VTDPDIAFRPGQGKLLWQDVAVISPARRCAAVLVLLAAAACDRPPAAPESPEPAGLVERAGETMGSELRVTAWTAAQARANAAFEAVFAEFERLDATMSVWRTGSDIERLNAAAGDRPVPVGADVREVITIARQISEWTGGKFDITFAALSGLWKFDNQDKDGSVPSPAAIAGRLPFIDYRALQIDDRAGTAFLTRKGMRVNLGGIGKGYAVDRGAAILRSRGFTDFMIQAGGDLYVAGARGDRPWRVAIRDPRGPADAVFASLDLRDGTFSTSGDYERFFIKDGRRYHHIIDPTTGQPATGVRSVTIVADRAVLADALSTGVFLIGGRDGMALIERLPQVEGVIVTDANQVLVSSGLKGRITMLAQPTK
jgi:thiamine biosynthesis lipoprotein